MMITGRKPISDSILYSIKKVIPTLNEEWLVHGKGSMFIDAAKIIPKSVDDKFANITEDEFALYFTKHKERLLENEIIKVVIDKAASDMYIRKLKDDIKKLTDNS